MEKYCIIMPAHNEAEHIRDVIADIKHITHNIIVVDDGSSDDTFQIANDSGVDALRHIINLGKGAAVKTGCDYALKKGFTHMILVDADGQHDPAEISLFLAALKDYDIVFGVRKFDKNMPKVARLGNWFISKVAGFLYGIKLKDTQCGYRAFSAETYKKIRWSSSDYSMESEMIANAGRHKLKYKEIPIKTIYLDAYKGTTMLTGFRIVMNMLLWKLRIR